MLLSGAALELVLVACAFGVVASVGSLDGSERGAVAALLATAMGIQNAVARRLAVPDLTTTVLTMTLTAIAADLRSESWRRFSVRRLLVVGTMFVGAVTGAELVLHGRTAVALGLAFGLLALVSSARCSPPIAQRNGALRLDVGHVHSCMLRESCPSSAVARCSRMLD